MTIKNEMAKERTYSGDIFCWAVAGGVLDEEGNPSDAVISDKDTLDGLHFATSVHNRRSENGVHGMNTNKSHGSPISFSLLGPRAFSCLARRSPCMI